MKNYYEILGLCPGASKEQIEDAKKGLARLWHPDRAPEGKKEEYEEMMKSINTAADELLNPFEGGIRFDQDTNIQTQSPPQHRARSYDDIFETLKDDKNIYGKLSGIRQFVGDAIVYLQFSPLNAKKSYNEPFMRSHQFAPHDVDDFYSEFVNSRRRSVYSEIHDLVEIITKRNGWMLNMPVDFATKYDRCLKPPLFKRRELSRIKNPYERAILAGLGDVLRPLRKIEKAYHDAFNKGTPYEKSLSGEEGREMGRALKEIDENLRKVVRKQFKGLLLPSAHSEGGRASSLLKRVLGEKKEN